MLWLGKSHSWSMDNTYIDSFVVAIVTILEAAKQLPARIEHVIVFLSPSNEAYQHEEEKVVYHLEDNNGNFKK